tara:strand:- start:73 stop:519 length:447 start_codon:yes stop_codon:yes gene_type:complete
MTTISRSIDFGPARNKNRQYQNVYGAHNIVGHPSKDDIEADRTVYARQSYTTPVVKAAWSNVNRWGLQGMINSYTGNRGYNKKKQQMTRLVGEDDETGTTPPTKTTPHYGGYLPGSGTSDSSSIDPVIKSSLLLIGVLLVVLIIVEEK